MGWHNRQTDASRLAWCKLSSIFSVFDCHSTFPFFLKKNCTSHGHRGQFRSRCLACFCSCLPFIGFRIFDHFYWFSIWFSICFEKSFRSEHWLLRTLLVNDSITNTKENLDDCFKTFSFQRIVTTPLTKVTFRDFYLADQLSSISISLVNSNSDFSNFNFFCLLKKRTFRWILSFSYATTRPMSTAPAT